MSNPPATDDFDPNRYWEQRLTNSYTLGSVGWSGLGESFNSWMYAVRKRVFRRVVHENIDSLSNVRVLDVGSGTGFYLSAWQELGVRDLTGSDLTAKAVAGLHASFPDIPILQLDIGGTPEQLSEERYDIVSVMDVLYHLVDDQRYARAFHNLSQLLKPGGRLILSENCVARTEVGTHQVSRSRSQIEGILRDAHLIPVLQRPMFFLMNSPVDSGSRILHSWWSAVVKVCARGELPGWLLGAGVFPVELALVRFAPTGPSSKIIVCRQDP
jgi:2-polyprenyl-3-methyl-5-hydroxy-6-metoxy-1,4-benzoquinol methylase